MAKRKKTKGEVQTTQWPKEKRQKEKYKQHNG